MLLLSILPTQRIPDSTFYKQCYLVISSVLRYLRVSLISYLSEQQNGIIWFVMFGGLCVNAFPFDTWNLSFCFLLANQISSAKSPNKLTDVPLEMMSFLVFIACKVFFLSWTFKIFSKFFFFYKNYLIGRIRIWDNISDTLVHSLNAHSVC